MSSQQMIAKRLAHPDNPEWRRGTMQLKYGALENASERDKATVSAMVCAHRSGDDREVVLSTLGLS